MIRHRVLVATVLMGCGGVSKNVADRLYFAHEESIDQEFDKRGTRMREFKGFSFLLAVTLFMASPMFFALGSAADEPADAGAAKSARVPAEQKIRDALDGKQNGPTGDGVLDDVLGLIKSQGSVLDGSVLDQESLQPPVKSNVAEHVNSVVDRRARAAENLLRTSRLLVKLGPMDETRTELVAKMRREAVRLLTE